MLAILMQILPLFLIIGLGGLFGRLNKDFGISLVKSLNQYAYYIGFPCIILSSFLSIDSLETSVVGSGLWNLGILALYLGIVIWVTSYLFKPKLQSTFFVCVFFGNVAYLGFPLITELNSTYATSASLHIAGYLVLLFTFGIARLEWVNNQGKLNVSKMLSRIALNPLLLSSIAGILFVSIGIKTPTVMTKTVSMLSKSASPVVLFALGTFMVQNPINLKSLKYAVGISLIKLLFLPMFFYLMFKMLGFSGGTEVSIIMAAMPVAITPFVLADIYDMDKEVISNAIIISTILAIATIPLIVSLV